MIYKVHTHKLASGRFLATVTLHDKVVIFAPNFATRAKAESWARKHARRYNNARKLWWPK